MEGIMAKKNFYNHPKNINLFIYKSEAQQILNRINTKTNAHPNKPCSDG